MFTKVEHIWKSNWSFSKVVYLVARYLTFIDVPLILICEYLLYSGGFVFNAHYPDSLHSGLTFRVNAASIVLGIADR